MPNITVYTDNETYIEFLKLPDEERTDIRKRCVDLIKEELKNGKNTQTTTRS